MIPAIASSILMLVVLSASASASASARTSDGVDDALPVPTDQDAEARSANNAVYAEGGGPGLLYSLNYERIVAASVALRVGVSSLTISGSSFAGEESAPKVRIFFLPLTASYLFGRTHSFELGAGATPMYAQSLRADGSVSADDLAVFGSALAGYRYQSLHGGFLFRIGASPLINQVGSVLPSAYVSLGATF